MSYKNYDFKIKIAVVGEKGVGKSQIIARYTGDDSTQGKCHIHILHLFVISMYVAFLWYAYS